VVKNGVRTIKIISIETIPNVSLIVIPLLSTRIEPGREINIFMIEPLSNYYEIKIKYVDLLTELNYTDTAFLRTRYPTVHRPSVIDYTTVAIIVTIFFSRSNFDNNFPCEK